MTDYNKICSVLKDNYLFSGIPDDAVRQLLSELKAEERRYKKGAFIIKPSEEITRSAIVISGIAEALRCDVNGEKIIISHLTSGELFAEALGNSEATPSQVYVVAHTDAEIVWLDTENLSMSCEYSAIFMHRLIHILSKKILSFNKRIGILSKKRLKDRILTYLLSFQTKRGEEFSVPLNRNDMADYLAVDRSALSRELSILKEKGVIKYKKDKFVLNLDLDKSHNDKGV